MSTQELDAIVARKRAGIDNTEDESCVVLAYFDRYASEDEAVHDGLAGLFPLEFDQWCSEKEAGYR